jgi:hypothetical protein
VLRRMLGSYNFLAVANMCGRRMRYERKAKEQLKAIAVSKLLKKEKT